MLVAIDKVKYLEIYSDNNKKIHELPNDVYWNNNEDEPIAVNIDRYCNGDYVESEIDCDSEEEETIETEE